MMSKLDKLKQCGFLGVLKESDITSENYKEKIQEIFENENKTKHNELVVIPQIKNNHI